MMTSAGALVVAQAVLIGFQALWLSIGVYSNIRYPAANRDMLGRVLAMSMLTSGDYADLYAAQRGRGIRSTGLHRLLYSVIVLLEAIVVCLLWGATVCLLMSLSGWFAPDLARAIAIYAVLGFTAIWAAFLAGGQWFAYWMSDETPQLTHFCMLLWGIGTLLLVAI